MAITLALDGLGGVDDARALSVWRWFRAALVELYALEALPASFTGREGTRSTQMRVGEADPGHDWRPAEFNYDCDSHVVEFAYGQLRVRICVERSDLGDFVRVSLRDASAPAHDVVFHGTRVRSTLELADGNPHRARWEAHVARFASRDR